MKKIIHALGKLLFSRKGALLLLLGLIFIVHPNLANAAADPTVKENTLQSLSVLLYTVMDFLNKLLWPFLLVIGDLMDPQRILGPGMGDRLLSIWVQMRNLVNIAFVLVLLFVAFYNVLGFGGGEGEMAIKTALPKIVLGLILVNFTFVGGKIVLDLTNVATTAAFSLPEMLGKESFDFDTVANDFERNVCVRKINENDPNNKDYWVYWNETIDTTKVPIQTQLFCQPTTKGDPVTTASTTATPAPATTTTTTPQTATPTVIKQGDYTALDQTMKTKYFESLNANNVGIVMAVNMGALSGLGVLKPEGIESFEDITMSMMFSVLMYAIFAISYIVLGILLITRIVILWIALAVSPLAVLVYVVPQIKEWAGGGGDVMQKVIKQLISPIIVGASMSLGFLMISAWSENGNAGLSFSGVSVDQVMSKEFLLRGTDDLPQFIIAVASVVIVWTGVFAAASGTYSEFATNAIKGLGEKVGGFLAKAPLYAPTLQVGTPGKDEKVSIMAGLSTFNQVLNGLEYGTDMQDQMRTIASTFGVDKYMGNLPTKRTSADSLERLKNQVASGGDITREQFKEVASTLLDSVYSSKASDSEKERVRKEINQALAGSNVLAMKEIVNKSENAEALGLEEGHLKEAQQVIGKITGLTKTVDLKTSEAEATPAAPAAPKAAAAPASPPAAPATTAAPTTAPATTTPPAPALILAANQPAVIAAANLDVANTTLVNTALPAANVTPDVTAALTALTTARAAAKVDAEQKALDQLIAHFTALPPAPAAP